MSIATGLCLAWACLVTGAALGVIVAQRIGLKTSWRTADREDEQEKTADKRRAETQKEFDRQMEALLAYDGRRQPVSHPDEAESEE
ncbi:MAG: hypothetical protein RR197_05625 [Oscillospiraceae bacterium]